MGQKIKRKTEKMSMKVHESISMNISGILSKSAATGSKKN